MAAEGATSGGGSEPLSKVDPGGRTQAMAACGSSKALMTPKMPPATPLLASIPDVHESKSRSRRRAFWGNGRDPNVSLEDQLPKRRASCVMVEGFVTFVTVVTVSILTSGLRPTAAVAGTIAARAKRSILEGRASACAARGSERRQRRAGEAKSCTLPGSQTRNRERRPCARERRAPSWPCGARFRRGRP